MNSRKIFPILERLDKLQINELEGYRNNSSSLIHTPYAQLLIKYSRALEEAELEIAELRKQLKLHE